jgi:hypothetical protein
VDFFAPAVRLVIEVDGAQHFQSANAEYDKQRSEYLEKLGCRVLRFDDRQVLLQTDETIQEIFRNVTEAKPRQRKKIPPNLPFSKRGIALHYCSLPGILSPPLAKGE